jgi:hypothetical protein
MDTYTLVLLACLNSLDDNNFHKREKATNFLTTVNQVYDIEDFMIKNADKGKETNIRIKKIIERTPRAANIDFMPPNWMDEYSCMYGEVERALDLGNKIAAADHILSVLPLFYPNFKADEMRNEMIWRDIEHRKSKVK